MEVARGIHRQTLGVVNWYLVEDGGRFTVVDAGTPRDWPLLARTLASLGRGPRDVEAILLTHAHSDHTGFAEQARAEAGIRVLIHEAEVSLAKGAKLPKNEAGMTRYLFRLEAWRTLIGLLRRKALSIVPIAEVGAFSDGQVIDVPGDPTVVHAPGHTAGTAGLWFEDRSVLCTGDALVTKNPLTGRTGPQIAPAGLNVDSAMALASLSALDRSGAQTVLPGHGEPWTDGVAEAVRLARVAGRS